MRLLATILDRIALNDKRNLAQNWPETVLANIF